MTQFHPAPSKMPLKSSAPRRVVSAVASAGRRWLRAALSLAIVPLTALPAAALAERMEDIVQLEILDGGITRSGTHMGAIRLTLSEGWKTYWRAPGDAGIPPQFTWAGSQNVGAVSIKWPTPDVFLTSGFRTIGYHDQLILPLRITPEKPGRPVRLKGRMELGICKDVCVPSELSFDHQLDAGATRAISQFFFSADTFFRFRDAAAAVGITQPILPGILPVTNVAQARKFAGACGAKIPDWMDGLFEGLDERPASRQLVAATVAAELCRRLYAGGVRDFHFYTLNRADLAYAICHMLGMRPQASNAGDAA